MNLDDVEIYTVTIVRNIGVPVSFTVRRWKALFIIFASLFLLGLFIYGSVQYVLLKTENKAISNTLEQTNKRLGILADQISKKDREQYWNNEKSRVAEKEAVKSELLKQLRFTTNGAWITNRKARSSERVLSGAAVEIKKTSIKLVGEEIRIRARLANRSVPSQAIGGYLAITLINDNITPVKYVSATGGPLGEAGFPSNFKSGRQYYLKSKTGVRNITQKYTLLEKGEVYTRAFLFVYSYKGSLLSRKSISINKKIFLK
ncbi:MAG: hypothetical protein GY786_16310 [Proteobacteria bacterium]|nr:hypothetical protein [Pseudomonadota bacterium]